MKIRSARPVRQALSPRGFRTLAKFNFEVTPDVTVYDCSLVMAPDGNVLLYGPGREASTLSVSRTARQQIIEMALRAVGMDLNVKASA
ncbi:hypothetical protein RFM98_07160 [Mesorhizobium sp. VK9D]|uniref:hypothetical protein n=1 Tax=Mesorhizobium australafricanum TaxID=3072311 RepID=UPI002A24B52C|nr:hypothetical protein [Mesorhizobium sp. VK9D]MDX8452529.1 hypothetical protein [Mesorhizobium sp. VK9D]